MNGGGAQKNTCSLTTQEAKWSLLLDPTSQRKTNQPRRPLFVAFSSLKVFVLSQRSVGIYMSLMMARHLAVLEPRAD
jgi:hypothetical protein